MLLAIDTATHTASIALYDEQGVQGEVTWRRRETHTRSLMPELVRLLELTGQSVAAVRAIAVTTGPGSFTGLRSGLAAAKGLAFSLKADLIGVPTLDAVASAGMGLEARGTAQPPVCAVIQAGRARYGAALYENDGGAPRRVSDYLFGSAESVMALVRESVHGARLWVTGEVDAGLRQAFERGFGGTVIWQNPAFEVRRAGFVAALAWARWQAGQVDDIERLAPYYIPTAALKDDAVAK